MTDSVLTSLLRRIPTAAGWREKLELSSSADVAALLAALLTTRGDIIRRGSSAVERLALGSTGAPVGSDGTDFDYLSVTELRTFLEVKSGSQLIADDAVWNIGNIGSLRHPVFAWTENNSIVQVVTIFHVRTTASPIMLNIMGLSTNISVTTSDVTGTTGADGNITFSATDGALKIENRSGGSSQIKYIAWV